MSGYLAKFEKDLICSVAVSESDIGMVTGDHAFLDARLAVWRRNNTKFGLSGALLVSGDGIVQVLEGTAPAVQKLRKRVDANPLHANVRLISEAPCIKRQFGAWPLAYVGPSRWVQRALATHALAEMTADSSANAEFLIDLVLSFVGDGA